MSIIIFESRELKALASENHPPPDQGRLFPGAGASKMGNHITTLLALHHNLE